MSRIKWVQIGILTALAPFLQNCTPLRSGAVSKLGAVTRSVHSNITCANGEVIFNGGCQPNSGYNISGSSVSTRTFPDFEKFVWSTPINGSVNVTGLSGTVSLDSNSPSFTEALFTIGYVPNGSCPANGQEFPDYDSAFATMPGFVFINQFIIKAQGGHVELPVDYRVQYPVAASGCFFVIFDGSAGNAGTSGTMAANINFNTVAGDAVKANQMVGLTDYEHFQSPTQAFSSTSEYLEVNVISKPMHITSLVGSVSNAAFDDFNLSDPTGDWNTQNAFYFVPGCGGYTAGTFQDQDFFSQLPANAQMLYDVNLATSGRSVVQQEINVDLDLTVKPGDCMVQIVAGNANGSLDFESALFVNAAVGSMRPVIGNIDSVDSNAITGWACQKDNVSSIQVELYLDGAEYGTFDANQASESAVAQMCGSSGSAYRFNIPMTSDLLSHAGQTVTMYGLVSTKANNNVLTNSGTMTIPAAVVVPRPTPDPVSVVSTPAVASTALSAAVSTTSVATSSDSGATVSGSGDTSTASTVTATAAMPPSQTIYRYVGENGFHLYAASADGSGVPSGYSLEGAIFQTYQSQGDNMSTLYRCRSGGHQFLSTDSGCEGQTVGGTLGYVSNSQGSGQVPLYRMYSSSGDHLEGTDTNEGTSNGYVIEGILGYVPQ